MALDLHDRRLMYDAWLSRGRPDEAVYRLDMHKSPKNVGRVTWLPIESARASDDITAYYLVRRVNRHHVRINRIVGVDSLGPVVDNFDTHAHVSFRTDRQKEPTAMTTTQPELPLDKKPPKNVLSYVQMRQVEANLATLITRVTDTTCRYTDSATSDETVAAGMPFPCTKHNVAGVRRAVFGNLVDPEPTGQADIAELRDSLARAHLQMTNLDIAVRRMAKMMTTYATVLHPEDREFLRELSKDPS